MKRAVHKPLALTLAALLVAGGLSLLAQQRPPSEQPGYTLRVDVPVVNVDVTVLDNNGNFIPGLPRGNFRVYVDGVEQEIVAFAPSEAPITAVLLVEASPALRGLIYQNLEAAYLFLRQLHKDDWVALVAYDIKPRLEVDFTHDQTEIVHALQNMQYGGGRFSEVALYDALSDTIDNLKDVECTSDVGCKKSIIIIAGGVVPDVFGRGGIDTMSKLTWDQARKKVQASHVTIFAIDLSWPIENALDRADAQGYRVATERMDVQIGRAQLQELAAQTGGRSYSVRFPGELPGIYQSIGQQLRNQYSLAFRPKDFKRDGRYHKIEVKLVAADGQPLKIADENQKQVKYQILARKGYYAPES